MRYEIRQPGQTCFSSADHAIEAVELLDEAKNAGLSAAVIIDTETDVVFTEEDIAEIRIEIEDRNSDN